MSPAALELRAHLRRLLVTAIVTFLAGLGVTAATGSDRFWQGFGTMLAGWAVVNALIALPGLRRPKEPEIRPLREFLALNLGLNVAYIAVGVTLVTLGSPSARGMGAAVALQGLNLLALDGWLMNRLPKA